MRRIGRPAGAPGCTARWFCGLAIGVCLFNASGCATFKPMPPPTPPEPRVARVRPGDELLLTLRDGRQVQIEVQRIEGDTIVSGEDVRYAPAEITQVQVRRTSVAKTALLVGGLVAGAYAAVMIMVGLLWNGFL